MIRLHRGAEPPSLQADGRARVEALRAAHDADPASFAESLTGDTFDRATYGGPEVKRALARDQHGKCAFCESKILHAQPGDVEHYRPKRAVRQTGDEPLERPGYYWLAYDWNNLLLACAECNRRHKGNLFPLLDPVRRARSHHDDLSREEPAFIQPFDEDPEEILTWKEDVVKARDGNHRGEMTMLGLGLNREPLAEERRRHLNRVRILREALIVLEAEVGAEQGASSVVEGIRSNLLRSIHSDEPYAAMTRAWLAQSPIPPIPVEGVTETA